MTRDGSPDLSRRHVLGHALATVALAAAPPVRAAAPDPYKVHSFTVFKRPRGQTLGQFMRWYEELHAPGFVSLARAHIGCYVRNFVLGYRGQDPGFDALVEFGFATEDAQKMAREAAEGPRAMPLLGARLKTLGMPQQSPDAAKPRGEAESYPNNFTMTETHVMGPPRDHRPGTGFKTILILKRTGESEYATFVEAATGLAGRVAKEGVQELRRIVIDVLSPPEAGVPRPLDAVISVWTKDGIEMPATYDTRPEVVVSSVLDVESRESNLAV